MNYHIFIEEMVMKSGWTGHDQINDDGDWKRVKGLIKQFQKKGFKDARLAYTYTLSGDDADARTRVIEGLTHHLMGAKGLHAGNREKHGTGWTEIFNVSENQLKGYLGKAVQIAKKLDWDIEAIHNWEKDYAMKKLGYETWVEYLLETGA